MPFPVASPEPVTPESVPAAYRAAAKTMLDRDRKDYAAFRAVDQAEHERLCKERAAAEVDQWAEEVRLFGEDLAELEPEAEAALAAARAAEDRHRVALEDARQLRAEYERIKGNGKVREETDASLRADAADETAHHAGQAAEQAAGESRQADEALAEAREGLAQAERQLERARERAEIPPGAAAISGWTVRACSGYMQRDEVWSQLSEPDRRRVLRAAEPRPMMSDREWQARLRETFGERAGAV